jgi:two-component system phosphate regulon sensor histidine kinase PhoR
VQNTFLSSVSHELRTPLTSMRMFIDTLREDRVSDPAERAKCLAIVDQELVRLDNLVSKLLELSRIEAGGHIFAKAPVAISDVVDDALGAFEVLRLGHAAALDVQVEPGLTVVGDRPSLAQAVGNLLANAWKYSPADDKRIELRATSTDPKLVEIAVADNGPGIPRAERDRIFEYFERGAAARDGRVAGSGLGLAIVRAIARAHRGSVEVGRADTAGATFRLVLPRAAA